MEYELVTDIEKGQILDARIKQAEQQYFGLELMAGQQRAAGDEDAAQTTDSQMERAEKEINYLREQRAQYQED